MFGLKRLHNEVLKLQNVYENNSIALKGLIARVEQLEATSRELMQDRIEMKHDIEGESNENITSFSKLGESILMLEEKIERIEKRSKPGRKPKDGKGS